MATAAPDDEPADPIRGGGLVAVRLRLDLAYDGTAYAGWAAQPGQRTVQGVLEEALATLLRSPEPLRLTVAGRTDAGVHATGQVAHVDVPAALWALTDPGRLVRGLAALLPPDIRVRAVTLAPDGFDARFSALGRVYRYRVTDRPVGAPPLRRHDTLAHPRALDVVRMNAAAALLLGEHDFAAYCRRKEHGTTLRSVQRLDWRRDPDGILVATVQADAFCQSMVRSLVGAMLAAGDGRRSPGWPGTLLERRERASEVAVVAPHGLTLVAVGYPETGLAERAEATRRLRA
jgi:tRNA pseudouridine38-40 synthase